jgi:hypothetical protein
VGLGREGGKEKSNLNKFCKDGKEFFREEMRILTKISQELSIR